MISPIKFLKLQQVLHIHIAFYRKGKIRSRRLKLILFSDDQNENFTFVVLDSDGLTFRFGYCRRSNRESTCLCLIRYEYKINSLPDCCYFSLDIVIIRGSKYFIIFLMICLKSLIRNQ
jgi:hypothetical protein